ncbi:hypothetical protein FRC02_007967 [Tulasnella sp. 418]|nr:hypothetical protein FRC02_007967 [Tulasnella sp. 418]
MPTRIYDGVSHKAANCKKRPQLTAAQKADARQRRQDRDDALNHDIRMAHDSHMTNIVRIAKDHYWSEDFVGMKLGQAGAKAKKQRAPNAKNGWVQEKLKELNDTLPDGEVRWTMDVLFEIFGDEYTMLTDEQKEQYRENITEHRETLHPSLVVRH